MFFEEFFAFYIFYETFFFGKTLFGIDRVHQTFPCRILSGNTNFCVIYYHKYCFLLKVKKLNDTSAINNIKR